MKKKIRYKKNYSFKHRQIQKKKYPWNYLTVKDTLKLITSDYIKTLENTSNYFNKLKVYTNDDILETVKHLYTVTLDSIPNKYKVVKNDLIHLTQEFLKKHELSEEKNKENSLIILMNSLNIKE